MGRHGHRVDYLVGCELCVERVREQSRRRRRRTYAQRVRVGGVLVTTARVEHGTVSTYVAYGCRCDLCTRVHAEDCRDRYARRARERADATREDDEGDRTSVHADTDA